MKRVFMNVGQVASWRLCIGCGACHLICPENNIKLYDVEEEGIRPYVERDRCEENPQCRLCVDVCPGLDMRHGEWPQSGLLAELKSGYGPVLEVWEGYASDPEIRYYGSSGGAISAIALFCLQRKGMEGVLHTGADPEKPYANKTILSRGRAGLLNGTGSRYSPASPCDGLRWITAADRPWVFVGKPCDISGLRKIQALRPELDEKVGIALGIFCAGTPSTKGTKDFIRRLNLEPGKIGEIRYRGMGWPGMTTVRVQGEGKPSHAAPYHDSWGFLQRYRPYRCYLCPDGTSEFADISFGDPWHRQLDREEAGYSLVLARTPQGQAVVHEAIEAGYVSLQRVRPEALLQSQKNLFSKRAAIYGRLLTLKLFGVPCPRLEGFSLFRNWLTLPLGDKARSVFGTARRIVQRKYYREMTIVVDPENERKLGQPGGSGTGESATGHAG